MPSFPDVIPSLRFELDPDAVAYRAIAEQLRDLILSKQIVSGTKLPSIKRLAELWKTNYFTVQTALTPLVNEGLLVRRQKSGTFVSANTRQIKNVGIYFGCNFWQDKHAVFFKTIYASLSGHLESLGIGVHLFVDSRPPGNQTLPWEPLMRAVESKAVNAVIAPMVTAQDYDWLDAIPAPTTVLGANRPRHVEVDMKDLVKTGLLRLKERGCKKVGFVNSVGPLAEVFARTAQKLGLVTSPSWNNPEGCPVDKHEEFGFEQFKKIWAQKQRPDGLLVFPDNIGRGLIMAALAEGVRVPQDLKLVLHCNEEMPFFCPFCVDWIVISVSTAVATFWDHITRQAQGQAPKAQKLRAVLDPKTV